MAVLAVALGMEKLVVLAVQYFKWHQNVSKAFQQIATIFLTDVWSSKKSSDYDDPLSFSSEASMSSWVQYFNDIGSGMIPCSFPTYLLTFQPQILICPVGYMSSWLIPGYILLS